MNEADRVGRRVSPRPYIIAALVVTAIIIGGYSAARWYRSWAEECFRKPVRILADHEGAVKSVAVHSDGETIISGGHTPVVAQLQLWRRGGREEPAEMKLGTTSFLCVGFPPDGREALAVSSNGVLVRWDIESDRRSVAKLAGRPDLCSFAFSPDGKRGVSGGRDGVVRLWDIEAEREVGSFIGHADRVEAVAFSPEGDRALSGSDDRTVRLWNIERGREAKRFTGHTEIVSAVAFSPDGKRALSGGCDNTVRLWDIAGGKQVEILTGHKHWVFSVAFSPNGKHALSGGVDGTARLWDLGQGRLIRTFRMPDHEGRTLSVVGSIAFSPDGHRVVTGGWWIEHGEKFHAELLLWRIPGDLGLWLLDPPPETPAGRHGRGPGGEIWENNR